jgi:glycerol uptake facilitator-like aquaporin
MRATTNPYVSLASAANYYVPLKSVVNYIVTLRAKVEAGTLTIVLASSNRVKTSNPYIKISMSWETS